MHELSLASEILRLCARARDEHGAGRIEEVHVAVGELAAVEPDLLAHAWEAVVADGPDEGARLVLEWRPARQRCPACGEVPERQPGSWLRVCPSCSLPLHLEGGGELDLMRIVFQEVPIEAEVTR